MVKPSLFHLSPLLSPFLFLGILSAQDPKEIKFKARDLEKIKAELSQKKVEKQRLGEETQELKRSVEENTSKVKNFETSLDYTKQKRVQIEQQLASTKNQHDKLATNAIEQQDHLKASFKTYQVACLLNSPDSLGAVLSRQILNAQGLQLRKVQGKKQETSENLGDLVDTQQLIRTEVKKQEEKLNSLKSVIESRERLLNKKKTRQEILDAEMKDLQQTAEQLASMIDVLRTKAKEEMELEKEQRRIKQVSGASPILARSLPWPILGKVVTQFGRQQHPKLGTIFISNGIVIASPEVQMVSVVGDGKVLFAGEFMSYGNMVVVEHPGDWFTVYGQLDHWDVEKGQVVKKSDKIGTARRSPTGGFEAYFELRFYGKSTNPLPWLVKSE